VAAAAQDEVSTAIAALFGRHAQQFQALSAKAAAFHHQFVQALTGGAESYVKSEAANVLRLIGGDHGAAPAAALSKAAAATPGASGGLSGLAGKLGFKALEAVVGKFAEIAGEKVEGLIQTAHVPEQAARIKQILTNGVKLVALDGSRIYTDGKAIVVAGGRLLGLTEGNGLQAVIQNDYAIRDILQVDPGALKSLLGSELHVFARGEGLAQSYFQKVGNEIYQIDTNAQGQIIQRLKTTEAIFKRWVAMTINGPRRL
jgi:hypothetical protein